MTDPGRGFFTQNLIQKREAHQSINEMIKFVQK